MSAALCRTNSSGHRNCPPCTTPRSSSTIAFVSDAPLINPRACSSATSCVKPNVRAGASSAAKLSGVTSYVPACRPINGCAHSIATVSRNVLAGATTYAASLSVTVNGAVTVRTAASPPTDAGSALVNASKYGCTLPSRIGGSGPRSAAGRVTERLALGDGRRRLSFGWYEPLEVIHDLGEPVERELRAQKLAVRAGQRAEVRRLGGNVGDGPRLDEQSRAAPD